LIDVELQQQLTVTQVRDDDDDDDDDDNTFTSIHHLSLAHAGDAEIFSQ